MAEKCDDKFPDNAFLTETDKADEKEDVKSPYIKIFNKSLKPGNA